MRRAPHHIQLRLNNKVKNELKDIAAEIGISEADVVRGALYFGLPIFATMNDMQGKLIKRFVSMLKKEARKRPKGSR